jgi:hypothetical protein
VDVCAEDLQILEGSLSESHMIFFLDSLEERGYFFSVVYFKLVID